MLFDIYGNPVSLGATATGAVRIDTNNVTPSPYDSTFKSVNHTGYCTVAPANTLPAYKLSKEKGFFYVETDVKFTTDGVAVLFHDDVINSTGRNKDGSELTETVYFHNCSYDDLLTYDFGIRMGADYAGTTIAKFDDFIALCKNIGLHPYIELKAGSKTQIQGLVDVVERNGMKGKVTWIGGLTNLQYVSAYDKTARLGYVNHSITVAGVVDAKALQTGVNEVFIDTHVSNVTEELVTACINAGMPLEVYSWVNNESEITGLHPYVSGFTCNLHHAGKVLHDVNV